MRLHVALGRLLGGIANFFSGLFGASLLLGIDLGLSILNIITPQLSQPRYRGTFSTWTPREQDDSRSPCPAVNALANHGILPHDGKNIRFTDLSDRCHEVFNFSSTFSRYVAATMARLLGRDYATGTLNLSDMCAHYGIEHDASVTRLDTYEQPDQSFPNLKLVDRLLECASGRDKKTHKRVLTSMDLARFSHIRRTECAESNPQFMLDFKHKLFGSSNNATMIRIFGGKVDDLHSVLAEERLPEEWYPACRKRFGLTIVAFQPTVLNIELSTPNSRSPIVSPQVPVAPS